MYLKPKSRSSESQTMLWSVKNWCLYRPMVSYTPRWNIPSFWWSFCVLVWVFAFISRSHYYKTLFFFLLFCWCGYIVTFTEVLTMYQIYHTWFASFPTLSYSPSPNSCNSFSRYHFCLHIHVYTGWYLLIFINCQSFFFPLDELTCLFTKKIQSIILYYPADILFINLQRYQFN
jgi:hypothetical protein